MEMKSIEYRGGVVTFRIPADWVEEYGDRGGGTFYRNVPDAGTLRLHVTTMANDNLVTPEFVYDEVASTWNDKILSSDAKLERLPNGNTMIRYRKNSFSWFKRIVLHFWEVYNAVPPHHMRIALFSYTILRAQETDPRTLAELNLLDGEIRAAAFFPELGE